MSDKVELVFLPQNKTVQAAKGAELLEVARQASIDIEAACDGLGTCGKCLVQHLDGAAAEPHEDELQLISPTQLEQGVRLACRQTVTRTGRLRVLIESREEGKILAEGLMPSFELNPRITKVRLRLEKPTLQDNLDDLSRIERALGKRFRAQLPIGVLRQLPSLLRRADFDATVVFSGEDPIGVEAGDTTGRCYAVGVDIGTTTIVASLVDLASGAELASSSAINPQKRHGLDVLSRIKHVQGSPEALEELSRLARGCVDALVGEVCRDAGVHRENVYEIAVAANSTMMHLFLAVNPSSIGRSPYIPVFTHSVTLPARDLGISISPFGEVYCLPSVSAYVGADIVAGLLCAELAQEEERALFIDIGTNGEIVFSSKQGLFACSCAAGPAFEGMNISCGMRAGDGAIDRVDIDDDVRLHTIGEAPAIGLCGSGVLDAVAELVKTGVISASGRFADVSSEHPSLARRMQASPSRFVLSSAGEDGGCNVAITQKDVRQVQLAKGAILSGIQVLLQQLGIGMSDVERVYLAGAFGCRARRDSLARLGLLPAQLLERTTLIGNSSKAGAVLCLLSRDKRDEAVRVARGIRYIELSCQPDFDRLFTDCLSFPK
jgi:uncharacterized 2Fe-2S/4Fe-4S cluster protein (DUF4445 family)